VGLQKYDENTLLLAQEIKVKYKRHDSSHPLDTGCFEGSGVGWGVGILLG
jgi:hypothetical protein